MTNIHEFTSDIQQNSMALLDAATTDERLSIANRIADDPALASAILMLFSEALIPLLPPGFDTEGLIQ